MEGLGIDVKSLIFQLINFSVLIFILGKLLYKPLVHMLDARREAIKKSVEDAERAKRELTEIKSKQEEILSEARLEARHLLQLESQRAKKEYEETIKKTEAGVAEVLAREEKRLLKQKEEFKDSLRLEVSEMVRQSLRKVLSEGLTDEEKEKFVAEALKKVS